MDDTIRRIEQRQIEIAKHILESRGYVIEEASKPGTEYYKFLKAQIKKVSGVNATSFEDVSTRNPDYSDGYVSVKINVQKRGYREAADLINSMKDRIQSSINGAEVSVGKYDIPIISISINDLESIIGGSIADKPKKDTISYWLVSVGSMSRNHYAYGAKITDTDGWKFPTNLKRIQNKLGEKYFTQYYVNGDTKNFKSYDSLKSFVEKEGGHIPTEQELIDAGYEERYFTF